MYFNLAKEVLAITKQAGYKIIDLTRNRKIEFTLKSDKSPVTEADILANDIIIERLKALTPEIPVIAEESDNIKLLTSNCFWLVDPIDGTRSFVKGNKEYTVNIALIVDSKPVGGAIYLPAFDIAYFVGEDGLAYKQEQELRAQIIRARNVPKQGKIVVSSHHHKDGRTYQYIKSLPGVDKVSPIPSSLKFCLLAEGRADLYPRFGKTMEWDTAAGHAILDSAGGTMTTMEDQPFNYGKSDFINGAFLASGVKQ